MFRDQLRFNNQFIPLKRLSTGTDDRDSEDVISIRYYGEDFLTFPFFSGLLIWVIELNGN